MKRDRTIFTVQVPVWDVRNLIARMGGVGPMTEKLMRYGFYPPTADTVQGWSTRNSVPGAWSPAVFGIALKEGLIENPLETLLTRPAAASLVPGDDDTTLDEAPNEVPEQP